MRGVPRRRRDGPPGDHPGPAGSAQPTEVTGLPGGEEIQDREGIEVVSLATGASKLWTGSSVTGPLIPAWADNENEVPVSAAPRRGEVTAAVWSAAQCRTLPPQIPP